MKKLPIGIQNFKEIIQENHVYVDKTKYIYDLITGAKCYFLSRPRRFGKSLLLDTISEVFSGDKELFKGLWIYDSDYDFPKHPVLRIDMSNIANKTPEVLERSLSSDLRMYAKSEGLDIEGDIPSDLYKNLIMALYKKYDQRVVILIDEYDKPILDHILDVETAEANRAVIRGFYGVLKSMDHYLRFTFITGVSKFTKTSIFSEMNNLLDITMLEKYANICGIPVEYMDEYFHEHIEYLSSLERFQAMDNLHDNILAWYDGYSWDGKTRVINPFGLLTFFLQERFGSFWYASGSPKFLLDILKEKPELSLNINNMQMNEWAMDSFDVRDIQVTALLFQTGYLTVKEVIPEDVMGTTTSYILKMPNLEVREAFNLHILSVFTTQGGDSTLTAYWSIKKALQSGELQQMRDILKSLFAAIPYYLHINREAYYHSIFYAIMNLLGFEVSVEIATSMGRIDATLEHGDRVYIIEFKYKDCPQDADEETKRTLFDKALDEGEKQIKDMGYADKYSGSSKQVIQAAFAFLGRDDIEMRVL